jgi:hypothetical protein
MVGDDAAKGRQEKNRQLTAKGYERQEKRGSGQFVDQPALRDQRDPRPDKGNQLARIKQPVVSMPKDTYQCVRIGIKDGANIFLCRQNLRSDRIECRLVALYVSHYRFSSTPLFYRMGDQWGWACFTWTSR